MSDGWVARLIDARFSAEETTMWERLVESGVEPDTAVSWMLMRRRIPDVQNEQTTIRTTTPLKR